MKNIIHKLACAVAFVAILLYTNGCGNSSLNWSPASVPDTEYCAAACEHIGSDDAGLSCEEGKPIEMQQGGCDAGVNDTTCVSCVKFCYDTQQQGVWLNPKCVVNIKSCDQIDNCQEAKR
jgi:hypothetical protein